MITLSLERDVGQTRIKPQTGLVYKNTKGNYVLVVAANDQRESAQVITFNVANGKLVNFCSYSYHCIAKWQIVGRCNELPQIEVVPIDEDEIQSLEKYRG